MKQIGLFEAHEREMDRQREARVSADFERRRAERIAVGLLHPAPEATGPQDVLNALGTSEPAVKQSPPPDSPAEGP